MAFEARPWRIDTCGSAEDALLKLRAGGYDMLIADKNLPGMTGVDLVRAVRERDREIGVVMITGYASTESAMQTLNLGIDAYLEKPFANVYDLAHVIARVLKHRAPVRPPEAPSGEPPGLEVLVVGADARLRISDHLDEKKDRIVHAIGAAALRTASSQPFDLIIVDARTCGIDALVLIAELRAVSRDSECALLSERMRLAALKQLIELRVRAFIDGSPSGRDFAEKLKRVVAATRERKHVRRLFGGKGPGERP